MIHPNSFLIPAGYQAKFMADANVVGGVYQKLGQPGEPNDLDVVLPADQTTTIGPFNEPRFYDFRSTSGTITKEVLFAGYQSFDPEPDTGSDGGGTIVGAGVSKTDTLAVFRRTVLDLVDVPVVITDDAGVIQFGGTEIFNFPQGSILIQSASLKGNFTAGVTGTVIPTFTGIAGLGTTVAATGATLATTQSDILLSTAMATAVAKVAAVDLAPVPAIPNSGARWLDGRTTAKKMFVNFKITDDATHTSGTAKFTGQAEIIWTDSLLEGV